MKNEKEAVALSSIFASALMAGGKFTVGMLTGSLGILSEALHSLLDLGATIMTYYAVRVSDKPADELHHYGHGKIESVTALAETVLLFITCFWILYEAIRRLMANEFSVEVTWWSIAVIVVSIVIDISRARALSRVAKKTKSQALEADALHFSSDVYSSAVVLLGLGFTAIGWPRGDAIAAIGVAMFVCLAGWRLGRRTIDTLLDAAPVGVSDKIKTIVANIPTVIRVERVRVRPAGSVLFIQADVAVGRGLPLSLVSVTKKQIVEAIVANMPEAEVTVTTHPLALDSETVHERVGIIAAAHDLSVHHVTVHQIDDVLSVGLDLETEGTMAISEAHAIASQLETAIRDELGNDVEVETHIEPQQTRATTGTEIDPSLLKSIAGFVQDCAAKTNFIRDVHEVRARQTDQGIVIIFHCLVEPQLSVAEIHEGMDSLEHKIRTQWPNTSRVVGHAEPFQ
jgi:cation diffusion facilitator family transporter